MMRTTKPATASPGLAPAMSADLAHRRRATEMVKRLRDAANLIENASGMHLTASDVDIRVSNGALVINATAVLRNAGEA